VRQTDIQTDRERKRRTVDEQFRPGRHRSMLIGRCADVFSLIVKSHLIYGQTAVTFSRVVELDVVTARQLMTILHADRQTDRQTHADIQRETVAYLRGRGGGRRPRNHNLPEKTSIRLNCTKCANLVSSFSGKLLLKLLPPDIAFDSCNAPNSIRAGRNYSPPPDPIAVFWDPTSNGRKRRERGREKR